MYELQNVKNDKEKLRDNRTGYIRSDSRSTAADRFATPRPVFGGGGTASVLDHADVRIVQKQRYGDSDVRIIQKCGWSDSEEESVSDTAKDPDYEPPSGTTSPEGYLIYYSNAICPGSRCKITMQGTRAKDKKIAAQKTSYKISEDGYAWHHIENEDIINGKLDEKKECYMELVDTDVHNIWHIGAVAQYRKNERRCGKTVLSYND